MAKKIKFPLVMKDDAETRTLEEFKENFDIEKAVGYFLDGKLLAWLEARYYDTEADAVRALDKNDAELRKKLCGIFGVEYDEAEASALDVEAAEERNRKLAKLRQYTSDPTILEKVDSVAFDQEDLADLLDDDVHDIYLCNNSFVIPLRVEDKKYIGIGNVEAVIKSEEWVDFTAKKIVFEGVEFDAAYAKKEIAGKADNLLEKGLDAEKAKDVEKAFSYFIQAAEAGNAEGMYHVARSYTYGIGCLKDVKNANLWLKKAIENGSTTAMIFRGDCHWDGAIAFGQNYGVAIEWYTKAANKGNTKAMIHLGWRYRSDDTPPNIRNIHTAISWLKKAAELDDAEAANDLAHIFYCGEQYGIKAEYDNALKYAQQAIDLGNAKAMYYIAQMYYWGNGMEKNIDKSLEWHLKRYEAGDHAAASDIAQIYRIDLLDYAEAIQWYKKAVKYNQSQGYDGSLYENYLCELEQKMKNS